MKRFLCLILCCACLLTLTACGPKTPGPEVVEKKDFSQFAGMVADPKTWYENFMKLPVANENMTEQELRQLVVDAFAANMSFTWTPTDNISYTYELLDKYSTVNLPKGIAYSGLFYATGVKDATCGNIWKVLPYYDHETGAVDVEAMGDQVLNYMSSACSYGAMQGWNRVINSHGLDGMDSYSQYVSNIVPVGPYKYKASDYKYQFISRTASDEIIAANGEEIMWESIANGKMGDGLYSSSSWHVMMYSRDPELVYNDDGTLNPYLSYVYVHEQGATGTGSDKYNVEQENGAMLRPLGTLNNKFTIARLVEKGYIPFTFKEFTGEDPIEPGKAWVGEKKTLENGTDISLSQLSNEKICGNYNICTLLIEVKTPDGQVMVSYVPNVATNPAKFTVNLFNLLDEARLKPYADGKNTLHISAQLSNGEKLEGFQTVLKVD